MSTGILSDRYESVDVRVRIFLFIVDLIGGLFFPPWKNNKLAKSYHPQKVRKILILRMDGLGDLVLSSAAIREIRRGFPNAEITLAVGSWNEEITKCIPYYNNLIVHDCFLFSFFRSKRKIRLKEELDFIKRLRQSNYDLGIDLRGDLLSIIPLFLSGARFRFAKDSRGGGFLLTHVVDWEKNNLKHEKDKAQRLVETLGIKVCNEELELKVRLEDVESVEKYLSNKGLKLTDSIISIAPSALFRWKSWRPERFARLSSIIVNKYNFKVLLIGSHKEKGILDKINGLADNQLINTAGDLALSQIPALIKRSSVFIGNDSGLIHIAYAMKTPMIQLFGPGEPEVFGYADDRSILIMKNDCRYRPCRQKKCKDIENWCMDKISVSDVMRAFEEIIYRGTYVKIRSQNRSVG